MIIFIELLRLRPCRPNSLKEEVLYLNRTFLAKESIAYSRRNANETRCNLLKLHILLDADMAPRKRTTKQRKNDPKTAKLEAFLQDFDSEGKKP